MRLSCACRLEAHHEGGKSRDGRCKVGGDRHPTGRRRARHVRRAPMRPLKVEGASTSQAQPRASRSPYATRHARPPTFRPLTCDAVGPLANLLHVLEARAQRGLERVGRAGRRGGRLPLVACERSHHLHSQEDRRFHPRFHPVPPTVPPTLPSTARGGGARATAQGAMRRTFRAAHPKNANPDAPAHHDAAVVRARGRRGFGFHRRQVTDACFVFAVA